MTHPPMFVFGYSEAAMFLRKTDRVRISAIIAIHGQREYPVNTEGVAHSLVLQFDDTEAPSETDPIHASRIRLRRREAAEYGLNLRPPAIEDAESIIEFARGINQMDGALLCHCQGGVSRSPAAALLCLATWMGSGHENYSVEHLLTVRPCAVPHPDLVKFGDKLLGREGRLVDALERARPS